MDALDLQTSLHRAETRLAEHRPGRRPRSDRGESRLAPPLQLLLSELLSGQERPPVRQVQRALKAHCDETGSSAPARATIYAAMARMPSGAHDIAELPPGPRRALYNLAASGQVPGHQLAFYCFNYGDSTAVSFAAGLPWLALYQAARLPGWRPRSRGLLDAVRKVRGI